MADKFLNLAGVTRLWNKIKTYIDSKISTLSQSIPIINVPTQSGLASAVWEATNGYSNSIVVISDGVLRIDGCPGDSTITTTVFQFQRASTLASIRMLDHAGNHVTVNQPASGSDAFVWNGIFFNSEIFQATDDLAGVVRVDSDNGISLGADGELKVTGRLGQMADGTGIFAPSDRNANVANNSFLITEALGYRFNSSKSFGVLTGAGITCRSAAAGATTYRVANNHANRIICKALEGGILALNETEAKAGNIANIVSVLINGSTFIPDSSANPSGTTYDIVITVDKTVNPSSATTSIRGYGCGAGGYSNLAIGQLVTQGTAGASALIGSQITNAANFSLLCGTQLYSDQSASALFGRQHINRKQNCLLAGQGHDTSSGSNGVAAVGKYSNISSNTAFAVGNGTNHTTRMNAFEVTSNSEIILLSPNKTAYVISVTDTGELTVAPKA